MYLQLLYVYVCVYLYACMHLCSEGEVFGEPLLLQPFCPPLLQVWPPARHKTQTGLVF